MLTIIIEQWILWFIKWLTKNDRKPAMYPLEIELIELPNQIVNKVSY